MLDNCNEQINAFYGRYADKEGISLSEAKRRVKTADIKEFERKAARYVRDASLDRKVNKGKTDKSGYYFSAKANEEMRLYNATMRINRLEMLKANIGLELIKGHDELEKFMGDILKGRTEAELQRQAGILGKTITNNAKAAHAIVNASYHNATFSDRVWMYHDIMKADLSKMLKTGLVQGRNPRVLARELEKYVLGDAKGGAKFNAERLMRTELARVQTAAQKQSFERNGFEEYTFLANSNCCDICQSHNGNHYKVADMMPGENAPPLHCHCRCSTAAHSDRKEYDEWLNYLEQGGTTELSETDIGAIYNYMSAKSYKINEKLRSGVELSKEDRETIKSLDEALKKMPTYSGNLLRSLYFNSTEDVETFMKDYTAGKVVTYKEYISTTKGSIYNPDGQVCIVIKNAKKGRDISTINKKEKEVLYERGLTVAVKEVVKKGDKYYILVVEQ